MPPVAIPLTKKIYMPNLLVLSLFLPVAFLTHIVNDSSEMESENLSVLNGYPVMPFLVVLSIVGTKIFIYEIDLVEDMTKQKDSPPSD